LGPKLPIPLANFAFSKVDDIIYVAGGISKMGGDATKAFYRLDLGKGKWESLPTWDGKSRAFAIGAAQSNGLDNCFYLFSGRDVGPNDKWEMLYHAHSFNPVTNKWTVISQGKEH